MRDHSSREYKVTHIATIMDFIAAHLPTVMNFLVGALRFVFVLGVLVFVHELGHFLAAKLCNVYVVRFSFGWGKRLFGFKRGETDYCISAIPIGGYVKMVGQEDMPRSEEEAQEAEPDLPDVPPERRFNTQPAVNKLAISFAGPFMNLIFAFPVFWLVFMVGIQVPIFARYTRIGNVTENSLAEQAGIKAGQRVLSINGSPIEKWEELQLKLWTSEGEPLDLEIEDLSGEVAHVTVTPARQGESNRATIGIEPFYTVAVNSVVPNMPAEEGGIKAGDIILGYADQPTNNESMGGLIETVNKSAGIPLALTVQRGEQVLHLTVVPDEVSVIDGAIFDDNVVVGVDKERADSVAALLKPGDIITAVEGNPLRDNEIKDFLATRIYKLKGPTVEVTVERPLGLLRQPERLEQTIPLGRKGMMGVVFSPVVTQKFGPVQSLVKSVDAFGNSFSLTMKTIYFLFSGRVSTREMAGPIGIAVLTEESLKLGIGYYLNFIAFITINLAIINLLPIPALDGGMILITLVESVRRKPIEERYFIWLQYAGWIFILLIILVATFNDIGRTIRVLLGGSFLE